MDAMILPAGTATPTAPSGKASMDARPDPGFSDAMATATADGKPAPSGGSDHISPIVARTSGGKPDDVRDVHARTGVRDGKSPPPRADLPGIAGAADGAGGRLPRVGPGAPDDAKDPARSREDAEDVDQAGIEGLVAGMLSALPGAPTTGPAGGQRPVAANARIVRADGRDATGETRTRHADAEAEPDARKPADAGTQSGASRYQLQRLQQANDAAARSAFANPSRTPVDPAALARHLAWQASAPADAVPGAAGSAATHASGGSAPAATGALFGLGSITPAHSASGASAMPVAAALASPVGSPAWPHELGQQVVQMIQRGTGQIDLHLNPRELGPVQISLQLHDQTAQVHFLVAHADVQHAVQQALPQLRDALAGQGIALGNALVGQQQQQHSGSFGASPDAPSWSARGAGDESAAPVRTASLAMPPVSGGGVDLYA